MFSEQFQTRTRAPRFGKAFNIDKDQYASMAKENFIGEVRSEER
jgi:hypothetical protein